METNVTASVAAAKDAGRVTGDTGEDMKEVDAKNQTFLIIVSYHRSGSSLVGEIFNNHPDVMYFFEPMVVFPEFRAHDFDPWLARKRRTIAHGATIASDVLANAARLLADMHACDWSGIAVFSNDHRRWPSWPAFLSRSRAIARAAGCDARVDVDRSRGTLSLALLFGTSPLALPRLVARARRRGSMRAA
ncbi:PREDICTED: uncharacterized protein LOC106813943 [Priapulus caudatus]|uniref:Uncharacterized protein LOC106813943 n=1 Tax=Priapulus caudatus TaxID=37621 RepID=A0ABM1ENA4_PRICU|nr:PREDICTED: uncharacterized protein LOC106813943 [Priapulus caudatus]